MTSANTTGGQKKECLSHDGDLDVHPRIYPIYLRPIIGEGTNGDHEFERDLSIIKDKPI